jgi:hypothetical protein
MHLKEFTKIQTPRLRTEGLVTRSEQVIMEAADGTVMEVFEWLWAEAIKQARSNAVVHQM